MDNFNGAFFTLTVLVALVFALGVFFVSQVKQVLDRTEGPLIEFTTLATFAFTIFAHYVAILVGWETIYDLVQFSPTLDIWMFKLVLSIVWGFCMVLGILGVYPIIERIRRRHNERD